MIRVSIIIPVYNAEKYLTRCLDSVMAQTFKDIEIICVNDGSTDNSPQILEDYAKKDNRIKVIYKKNGGLVSARKAGVVAAKGDYVGYVDSDDWIEPDMYERLYEKIQRFGCDIVASGIFRQFSESTVKVINTIAQGLYNKDRIQKEILPQMLYNGIYYQMGVRPNLVNKLFRREVLFMTQMKVPEGITNGEDVAVTYLSILHAERICLTDEIYYHYRQHDNSMTKTIGTESDISKIKELYRYLKDSLCVGEYKNMMLLQLNAYISNILVQRGFEKYDREGELFSVFGGRIKYTDTVTVYGAGNFGRQVYGYAKAKGIAVFWVDKRYEFYHKQGLDVLPVEELARKSVDYILIAIIDEETAGAVRNDLVGMGIDNEKIEWLDIGRLISEETLHVLGI